MKKPNDAELDDELRLEYKPSDFKTKGVRGKYAARYRDEPATVKFIVNEKGRRLGVILDIRDYRKLLDALEELECIKAYDEAVVSGEEAIPLEQAIDEIENQETSG